MVFTVVCVDEPFIASGDDGVGVIAESGAEGAVELVIAPSGVCTVVELEGAAPGGALVLVVVVVCATAERGNAIIAATRR